MSKLKKYIYHNQHQHCYDAHNLFIKTDYATVSNQALNGALLGGGTVGGNAGIQPYKYGTKELDRQNGLDWYVSQARMYDPLLGRTPTMDPLSEKYYSISPYAWCGGNPILFVDPSGSAVFWHDGKEIGNDGVDDGKIFLIKTTLAVFVSDRKTVNGAGLSEDALKRTIHFIKKNSGNIDAFKSTSIAYENSIEIESSAEVRQAIVDIVSQDNGKGGSSDRNNREYGGYVDNGEAVEVNPGPVTKPSSNGAHIDLPSDARVTFHGHPSGHTNNWMIQGSNITSYMQFPSKRDIMKASDAASYVIGCRDGMTYVYNNDAIQAVIPTKYFVHPKNK